MTVTPTTGYALQTSFVGAQSGWIDDVEDYPLTYDFLYQLTSNVVVGQPTLFTIVSLSALSSVSTLLPAGLPTEQNKVTFYGRAEDIYLSSSNVSTVVVVTSGTADPSTYLKSALTTALASGDTDAVYRHMNVASAALSSVDCSLAPNCTALNRASCAGVVNTCGKCLQGYTGLVGDSNKKCVNGLNLLPLGATCKSNNDCQSHDCVNTVCVDPGKTCPSATSPGVCSGHGSCRFVDIGGSTVSSCGETDVHCSANCVCQGGYGGVSCSLSPAELIAREAARVSMCNAVLVTAKQLTPSAKLVDKLVSTVLSAYDPTEVRSTAGIVNCSKVLNRIGQLASAGYMTGTTPNTPTDYAELITLFTASLATLTTNTAAMTPSPTASAAVIALASNLQSATKSLVTGANTTHPE